MKYHAIYWGADSDNETKRHFVPIKKTIGEISEHLRIWIERRHLMGGDIQIVVYSGTKQVRCHGLYWWDRKREKMVLIEHYYDRKVNICDQHEDLLFFHPFTGNSYFHPFAGNS